MATFHDVVGLHGPFELLTVDLAIAVDIHLVKARHLGARISSEEYRHNNMYMRVFSMSWSCAYENK